MKKILFVCVENSCRSQMAEGFANVLGKGIVEAYSSGSKPAGAVNPDAISVMKEAGIDISQNKSKGFSELETHEFDYVITMGCNDICPLVPAKLNLAWEIEDPKGKDMQFFRKIRDKIEAKVKDLIKNILLKSGKQ